MIIDLILDRKDGFTEYDPKNFFNDCMDYHGTGDGITRAMDSGREEDVKRELCRYIIRNHYNTEICNYINSVNWIE